MSDALVRIRLGVGLACVLVAGWVFATHALSAVRGFDANVDQNSWRNSLDRLVAPGDITGLDKSFQVAALQLVPKNATFTVIGPPNPEVAQTAYGMNSITQAGLDPWLRYLLLPARVTDPQHAQYILCYGCDTDPWATKTTWLWKNDKGEAVGKVNGR